MQPLLFNAVHWNAIICNQRRWEAISCIVILSSAMQVLCMEFSIGTSSAGAFYILLHYWASFCWLTDLHGVTLPPPRNSSCRKNPGNSGGGILLRYTRILLEIPSIVLLKYFWWLNVNSIYHGVVRGARKHLEKYKHSHLAVSFVTTAITHQILVKSFHSCVFEQLRVGVVMLIHSKLCGFHSILCKSALAY